jgi:hypothetical protein
LEFSLKCKFDETKRNQQKIIIQNFEPTIFLKCPTFLGDIIKININMRENHNQRSHPSEWTLFKTTILYVWKIIKES